MQKSVISQNIHFCIILLFAFLLLGCAQDSDPSAKWGKSAVHTGQKYDMPQVVRNEKIPAQIGYASYYANCLDGNPTTCGDRYCKNKLTAAHRRLPFGTLVRVTRLSTGKQVIVVINDRGPHSKKLSIDLSFRAANEIDLVRAGVAKVKLEVVTLVK